MTKANTLRVVDEINDPLEVATREVAQVEAERAEINAKIQELRAKKAEVDGTIAAGDHRKINDDLLERGWKCEAGIKALGHALGVAETRRIEAEERASAIRRARAEVKATADVAAATVEIEKADADVAAKVAALLVSCAARDLSVQTATFANQVAAQYGLPTANLKSTHDLLATLAKPAGLFIGPAGMVRPAYRVA
jgi:hypothetical protein